MKIIPQQLFESIDNPGERTVFDLLEAIDTTFYSIALHSLNIVGKNLKEQKKRFFENDFMVLTPNALISLEVKTGLVGLREGLWEVYKRDNRTLAYPPKRESPYIQAQKAGFAFKSWLIDHGVEFAKTLEVIPVAVLCSNYKDSLFKTFGSIPELELSYVISADELTPESFKKRIEGIHRLRMKEVNNFSRGLSEEQVNFILEKTRPNVDLSFPDKRRLALREQERFTNEQLSLIDILTWQPRFVIDGGAGTGKTFLLEHLAFTDQKSGKKVAVVTGPSLLAERLRGRFEGTNISVFTYQTTTSLNGKFDSVFVDESQDFLTEDAVLQIFELVSGGIENGRWGFFGDFQNQKSIYASIDQKVFDELLGYTHAPAYPMKRNVRNTPEIVRWLEKNCNARVGETISEGYGIEVLMLNAKEILRKIDKDETQSILTSSMPLAAIFPDEIGLDALSNFEGLHDELNALSFSEEEFKGLEAETIIVCGLDGLDGLDEVKWTDYLYKAASRARTLCIIHTENKAVVAKALRKMSKHVN